MSGPEWTPEQHNAPADGRPLSGDLGAAGPAHPRRPAAPKANPSPTPATPGDLREDVEAEADHLDHEAEAEAEAGGPARPGKLAGLLTMLRSLVTGWLARRRSVGRAPDDVALSPDPDPADPEAVPDGEDAPAPRSRWSPAAWTWETRVGLAAVLSFVVLVGVFIGQRWLRKADGKAPPTLALRRDGPAPTPPGSAGDQHEPDPRATPATTPPPAQPPKGAATAASGPTPATIAKRDEVFIRQEAAPPTGTLTPPTPGGTETTPAPDADALIAATPGDANQPLPLPSPTTDTVPLPPLDAAGVAAASPGSEGVKPADAGTADAGTADAPAVIAEAKPPAAPATAAPAPPVATAPTEATPAPANPGPVVNEPPAMPTTDPTPSPTELAANPKPPSSAANPPLQPATPGKLEAVPSAPSDSPVASRGDGWVVIPSAAKRPGAAVASDPADQRTVISSPRGVDDAGSGRPARARVADGPPIRDDPAPNGQLGSVLHTVQPGENFWTISKDFYNSGRYYEALHRANEDQVPKIDKLYVGTVIRIPPPETLDRSLVKPLAVGAAVDGASVSRTSSAAAKSADPGAEGTPTRGTRPGLRRARSEPVEPPRKPTYRVRANDTLRSIARDTLDDGRRAGEIYNLNRDLLDDPKAIPAPDTILTLPDDAVVGRRPR